MAILYTYPKKVGNATNDDVIIIADSDDSNKTKTIKVSQLPASSGAGITLTTTGTTGQAQLTGTTLNVPQYQGQLNLTTTGSGAATLSGNNLNIPVAGSSGLGSVGLTMPSGFTVANSPLTADGTIGVTINGGSNSTYYRGDGSWATPTDTTYSVMGSGNSYAAGLVLAGSATHGNQFLRKDGTWQTAGSSYTLPLATSSVRGGVKIGATGLAAKNYAIQLDGNERMYVAVPWTDTATTPSSPANSVQFNNGGSFGGSANLTFSTDTLTLADTLEIKGDSTNPGTLKLYCENVGTPHAVSILGPVHASAVAYEIRLPNAAPNNGQILQSSGSGQLSWVAGPTANTNIGNSDLTLSGVRTLANDIYNLNFTSNNSGQSGVGSMVRFQNYVTSNKLGVRVDYNLRTDGQAWSTLHAKGNVTGNVSIDWDDGNVQEMTLSGNINLTQANCNPGGTYILIIHQDAESAYTITWSTDFDWMNNNTAPGAITSAKTDVYTFVCRTATSLLGTYAEDFIT